MRSNMSVVMAVNSELFTIFSAASHNKENTIHKLGINIFQILMYDLTHFEIKCKYFVTSDELHYIFQLMLKREFLH